MVYKVELPLCISLSKNKLFHLNLNVYRNAHYRVLAKAKKVFTEEVSPLVQGLPLFKEISLEYILYPATNRRVDISNICSVVDKFFEDTLVVNNKIEDDNYHYVKEIKFTIGKVDKQNPRIDVIITPQK